MIAVATPRKGDSGRVPITSADEIRQLVGDVADHTVIEILEAQPTFEELEVAAVYARGEMTTSVAADHGLSGTSAIIYDVLMQDDIYRSDEP